MTSGMQTSAPSLDRSACSSAAESPIASAWLSGRASIARAIASSSPSRSSRRPIRVSGFSRVSPPGVRRRIVPPSAVTRGSYSPLRSTISPRRPNTRERNSHVFDSARFAEVGAADDQRVRVVQDAAGVEDPRVIDEAAAVHVAADVDAPRAQARLGDRRIDGLEVRGRDLVTGPLARQHAPAQPRDRSLGAIPAQPACARSLFRVRRPLRAASHLSPRHSGSAKVSPSACWPHIRSSRSGAALACRSTRETAASSSSRASGPVSGTLTVT